MVHHCKMKAQKQNHSRSRNKKENDNLQKYQYETSYITWHIILMWSWLDKRY